MKMQLVEPKEIKILDSVKLSFEQEFLNYIGFDQMKLSSQDLC